MPGHPIFSFLKLGVLLAASLALTGCFMLDDGFETSGSGSRGVSLSQAMQASASGSREPLHGSSSGESHTFVDMDVNASGSSSSSSTDGGASGGIALVSYENRDYGYQLPMDVGYARPFNGQIRSLVQFSIAPVSCETERYYLGLYFGGDIVELQPGSLPDQAVQSTWMLELGVAYRRYFTPAHAFVSPYIAINAALQSLQWNYRNPVFVGSDQVTSDSLSGFGGYAGFGVAFNRNSHLSFFGEAGFGGTVFAGETAQGFNNDVFDNYGYFSVKAGLCIKF